eukprot:scaffold32647_cov80-Phaeocystis_antarctica.AAC.1
MLDVESDVDSLNCLCSPFFSASASAAADETLSVKATFCSVWCSRRSDAKVSPPLPSPCSSGSSTRRVIELAQRAVALVRAALGRHHLPRVAAVPRVHRLLRLVSHQPPQVGDDLAWVVVGHARRPAGANALRAVDEDHRQDGHVVLGLDGLPVVLLVVEQRIVGGVEDEPRERGQLGEDVTRRRGVLAAEQPRAELAGRVEQRDVVGPDEGLRHADDGAGERGLAVVVGRVLGHVAGELRHLRPYMYSTCGRGGVMTACDNGGCNRML